MTINSTNGEGSVIMNRIIRTITALTMCFMLLICNSYSAQMTVLSQSTHTITFLNWNGEKLSSIIVKDGEMPVYEGAEPTKESKAQYSYIFAGWDPYLVPATEDAIYTATFLETVNRYKVTFTDAEGRALYEDNVEYGYIPIFAGELPTKAPVYDGLVFKTYEFTWTEDFVEVTEDVIYTGDFVEIVTERTITGITANNVKLSKADYNSTDAALVAAAIKEVVKVQYTFDDEGGNVDVAAEDITVTADVENKTAIITVGEFNTIIEYTKKASGYITPTIGGGGGSTPKDEEPKEEEPKTEEPTYTEYDEYGIIIEKNIDNGVLKLKINNADGSVNTYDCANLVSVNGDMYNLIYTDILAELQNSIYAGAFVKLGFDGTKISSIDFNTSTEPHLATNVDATSGKYNVVATLVNSKPKHTILITAYLNNELKYCKFAKCVGQQIVTAELNGTYDTIKINAVNSLSSLKPLCKEKLYTYDIDILDYPDTYGYITVAAKKGTMDGVVQLKVLTSTNSTLTLNLKSQVKIDGEPYSAETALEVLKETAKLANPNNEALDAKYQAQQLIKYKTGTENGETVISTIYTAAGELEAYAFKSTSGETAKPYANYLDEENAVVQRKLKYMSNNTFGTNETSPKMQFMCDTKTVVFTVPSDRTRVDKFRKSTFSSSSFTQSNSFAIEPYEYDYTTATPEVLVYYSQATSTSANVSVITKPVVVQAVNPEINLQTGAIVQKLYYVEFGKDVEIDETTGENKYSTELAVGATTLDGVQAGDIIKFVKENGVISKYQMVYDKSAGKLYNYGSDLYTPVDCPENYFVKDYKNDTDYYQVLNGTVCTNNVNDEGVGTIIACPTFAQYDAKNEVYTLDTTDRMPFNATAATKYYTVDMSGGVTEILSGSNALVPAVEGAENLGSKVVIVVMNGDILGVVTYVEDVGNVINIQGITVVANEATTTYEGDEAKKVSIFFNNSEIPADLYIDDASLKTMGGNVVYDEFIDIKLKIN